MQKNVTGSIITDCADANARARQELRFKALFGVSPTFTGVASYAPIEAAGNLLDQLDVLTNFPLSDTGSDRIILVNVAPRGEDVATTWDNGTPFYYVKLGKLLLAGTYEEQCLALLRDFGIIDKVELLDLPTVVRAAVEWGDLTRGQAERITNTQFRSLEFLPLVASWIWRGKPVPAQTQSLRALPKATGQAWFVDNFGNVKTTLLPSDIGFEAGKQVSLVNGVGATCYPRLADVPRGVTALTIGSSGYADKRFLEVVIGHRGSAAKVHGLSVGGPVVRQYGAMDISTLANKYDLTDVDKQLGNTFWSPVDVAYVNDWVLRAAAFKGEFHWHSHQDDEFFLVYKGHVVIDTKEGSIELLEGQGAVMPKGIEHRPRAVDRAVVLMLEPKRLSSTGDVNA